MTMHNFSIKLAICTIAFVFIFNNDLSIEAKRLQEKDVGLVKRKGTIKTIKSEDGDLIDCVDIYKQPAFNHLLLKNHKIQDVKIRQGSYSNKTVEKNFHPQLSQTWYTKVLCPEGTIPIRMTKTLEDYKKTYPLMRRRNVSNDGHEYSILKIPTGTYYGGHARLNIWNPQPEQLDLTLVQMWISSDLGGDYHESLEVGWMVNPMLYGDYKTRLFIYWTTDDYQSTGCYNLLCPGFIQTNPNIVMGGTLTPISTYGGDQYELSIDIYKDATSGNWVVVLNSEIVLGYWPNSLFIGLAVGANTINWGGEITNENTAHHTTTPMGSGRFASEGYQKACFVRELRVLDASRNWITPAPLRSSVDNPGCYTLEVEASANDAFFLGGPGYSDTCP